MIRSKTEYEGAQRELRYPPLSLTNERLLNPVPSTRPGSPAGGRGGATPASPPAPTVGP